MEEINLVKENKLDEKQKVMLYFFVYAFFGWILETVYCLITTGMFNKRGFLYGPLCPIYGFGAVILIGSLKKVKTNTIGKFFIGMIVFTIFEYVVSAVLEDIFGLRWWDYSEYVFNFQGRVCLAFSVAWGIIGILFVEKLHPAVKKHIEKYMERLPSKMSNIILYILLISVMIDFIFSVLKYLK